MITTLQQLHNEESQLQQQNEILAQQAILAGSRGELEKRGKNKNKSGGGSAAAAKKVSSKKEEDLSLMGKELLHQMHANTYPKT